MKRILSILAMAISFCAAFVACEDNLPELQEDLALVRCLTPTDLAAKVSNGQDVQFSWTKAKGATYFVLEIYSDAEMTALVGEAHEIPVDQVPFSIRLEADKEYYARVKGVDETGSLEDSKWASFDGPVKTSAVKSNMFLEFVAKTSTSVTVKWEAVDNELQRIEWKAGETVDKRDLTADEIAASEAVVTGLQPATSYSVSIWYASANRGEVVALTDPDLEGFTEVADLAALQSALAAKAPKIYIKAGAYELGVYDLLAGVEIVGEQGVDGSRPVIYGEFQVGDGYAGGPIRFETVELNGNKEEFGFSFQLKNGGAEDKTVESIEFKNCNITGYSKGIFYEWGKKLFTDRLAWDGCTIWDVNKGFENGGDGIDLRNASDIKSLEVINNTIYNGFRTFFRLDAAVIVGDIKIENNTIMNISGSTNTNNSGVMGIKCVPVSASFKNNLLLNMPDNSALTRNGAGNLTPEELGMAYSNNHYYNMCAAFFSDNDDASKNNRVDMATATAGGGSVLSGDPCYNAKGGVFNLTNADLLAAKVGAPKWQVVFVEKEEDLTLACLEGAKTWDFNDAKYFVGTVEKPRVRDFLFMSAADNKLNIADGVISFTAATPTKKNVPLDGYVAFKVNQPGSVYINAVDPEGLGNHLIVAVGPVDGSAATIKGGAVANADNKTNQKILISDITEESLVYVYASGPIGLSALAWALDLTQVNTALATPAPEIEPGKVDQGVAAEAVVTWAPVDNAGSYSVVFSGKTYQVEEGTAYTISPDIVKFLDAGSYKVEVYANPAEGDIYNTQSSAGVTVLTIAAKAAEGGSNEFVVSSAEDLLNAISSGKTDISLAYSSTPYELGTLALTAPLRLTGKSEGDKKPVLVGTNFSLSGDLAGSVILKNLELDGTGAAGSVFVEDKAAEVALTADTVAIYDSYIHDYSKALYDNSGKMAGCVQNVIFNNIVVENCSNGSDFIDMRAGCYHRTIIVNSTFANSARTFFRTDAGAEHNYVTVRNNTFYHVSTNASSKDNNGLFHIRSAAGSGMLDYKIMNNLFYSILIDETPENANGYPKFISKNSAALKPNVISNNYFYNIEEREDKADYSWWTANCSREEGLAGGGVVLAADPCKDAANYDFTLTNAVAMNSNIGDPRWNPMRGSNPTSEITVESVTDLLTAISAGKKTITLKAGTYDLTAVADVEGVSGGVLTVVNSLNLVGEKGATLVGGFKVSGPDAKTLSLRGLILSGGESVGNMLEIGSTDVDMTSIVLRDNEISAYKNRLFYMSQEGAVVASYDMTGNLVENMGTSGDFFDVRKGGVTAIKFQNNTFANGIRTFARIDAAVSTGSIKVQNNTFYNLSSVDSKDNNGIFHVRATSITPDAFVVTKNLFASMHQAEAAPSQANGYPKLVSTNSANVIPTFTANYYYDVVTEGDYCWWTKDRVTAEQALAGYGVVLSENPFKDAANGDFTLVNALAMSERIGDQRWNPNQTARPDDWFAVASLEDLLMAIDAGKTNIELAYGTYDFSADADLAGKLTVAGTLNLKGKMRDGKKAELIGGFKLAGIDAAFTAASINFNGNDAVDNFIDVQADASLTAVKLTGCDVHNYKNRFFYMNAETSKVSNLSLSGLMVTDMGTSGDCIDIRKGEVTVVSVKNSTFANGIRTFIRMDAAVNCGALTVQNNTFYNLCSVDNKDNNGIFHARSESLSEANYIVKNNIFAAMHKAAEAPEQSNGYPKLISTNKASKIPSFIGNLFFDVDAADPYNWWTIGSHEGLEVTDFMATATAEGGEALAETPFTNETPGESLKFNVKAAYDGIGDPRW